MWTVSYHGYFINGCADRDVCNVTGPNGYRSNHASLDGAKQAIRKAIRRAERKENRG